MLAGSALACDPTDPICMLGDDLIDSIHEQAGRDIGSETAATWIRGLGTQKIIEGMTRVECLGPVEPDEAFWNWYPTKSITWDSSFDGVASDDALDGDGATQLNLPVYARHSRRRDDAEDDRLLGTTRGPRRPYRLTT